ncbi:hypothetical protein F1559_001063 [Cyanidiococcus yangmingshanensis]|uniref:Nuclear pore complex protein n=1 Tax=Cyanidiococcus yangmingshanensis TaxID=2690220 RepID=A0A7J7IGT8_9RHOD|nr:hypothetical protein F1559_001063 [Cyanidiococcus yangmingshanensis]
MGLHDLYVSACKVCDDSARTPTGFDDVRGLLDELRTQRNLWLLIHILDQEKRTGYFSDHTVKSQKETSSEIRPAALDQLSRIFSDDGSGLLPKSIAGLPGVMVCRTMLEWLERAAALELDASIGDNSNAILELGSLWDPSYRWGLSLDHGLLFDIDAALRGDLQLVDEDAKADERLCRACFCLIRCGRLERASELLRDAGQYWRAALILAGRSATLASSDGARGSHWLLWRFLAREISRYDGLNFWEKAILCLLSGGPLPQHLTDSPLLEDRLWAQFWGLLDAYLENRTLCHFRDSADRSIYLPDGLLLEMGECADAQTQCPIDIPEKRIMEVFECCLAGLHPKDNRQPMCILPLLFGGYPRNHGEILRVLSNHMKENLENHPNMSDGSSVSYDNDDYPQLLLSFAVHLHWYLRTQQSSQSLEEGSSTGDSLLTSYILLLRNRVQDRKLLYDLVAHYIGCLSNREMRIRTCVEFAYASPPSDLGTIVSAVTKVSETIGELDLLKDIAVEFWHFTWSTAQRRMTLRLGEFSEQDLSRIEGCLSLLKEHRSGSGEIYAACCREAVRRLYLDNLAEYARTIVLFERNSDQPCTELTQESEWRCWCSYFDVERKYMDWCDYVYDRGSKLRPQKPDGLGVAELEAHASALRKWLEGLDTLASSTILSCLNFLNEVRNFIQERELEPNSSEEALCVRLWCTRVFAYVHEMIEHQPACKAVLDLVDVFADLATFMESHILSSLVRDLSDTWTQSKTLKTMSTSSRNTIAKRVVLMSERYVQCYLRIINRLRMS